MIGIVDFFSAEFYDTRIHIPHKIVSMKEAIEAYIEGKDVGIIQDVGITGARAIKMGKESTFTCDFDYLVNAEWVVFK